MSVNLNVWAIVQQRGVEVIAARFWRHVERRGSKECWPWRGASFTSGYGRVRLSPKDTTTAHRLAWMLTNGPVPDGKMICHRCDNPPCCNPAHLFPGTNHENILDCVAKGRRARMVGSAHPAAKLSEAIVLEIRRRLGIGEKQAHLARDYGVTVQSISYIKNRATWSHV